MRILMKSSIAALLIGVQTTAFSSNNYEDLVAEGYRWVNVDGPYASKFEDDAQRLSKKPTREETGNSALRNQKGTTAAGLVLPRDGGIVPVSVALGEAIAIFEIDIAAEFPVALFGSKRPQHFPEARNGENQESAFD